MEKNRDIDVLATLKGLYFGAAKEDDTLLTLASNRAYRDMCRTLNFIGSYKGDSNQAQEKKDKLKNNVAELIKKNLEKLKNEKPVYDKWHQDLCSCICDEYENKNAVSSFSYGQAQKWVNMTIKYLYILKDPEYQFLFNDYFDVLHIPIDQYVIAAAKDLGINKPKKCWSSWNKDEYESYQTELQEAINEKTSYSPFRWEFEAWLTASGRNYYQKQQKV